MGNMGGVYGKEAIQRIIHIQRLEQILKFLRDFGSLESNSISLSSDKGESILNATHSLEAENSELLQRCYEVLDAHLHKIMSSPYFLRDLMNDLKMKGYKSSQSHIPKDDLSAMMKYATPSMREAITAVKNIEFIQDQFPWDKRKLLEKLKEILLTHIQKNFK